MLDEILIPKPSEQQAIDIIDHEEAALFAPVVEYFCQKHQISYQSFGKINGWGNVLLDIDGKWILKIAAPNWALQSQREIEALTLLKDHKLPVPVPKLFHHGQYNGWVYFICDKLPGTNLHDIWQQLDFADKQRIVKQVGEFAKTLNAIEVKAKGLLAVDWPTFLDNQTANVYQKRKKQGLTGPLLDQLMPYIEQVGYQCAEQRPRLIHCDLHAGNLLTHQQNGQWHLSGVIDFGDAIISSDCHYELTSTTILMGLGDNRLNRTFLDSYGKSVADIERLQASLMVLSLLRHSGELGYLFNQYPGIGELSNWQDIARRFFAL